MRLNLYGFALLVLTVGCTSPTRTVDPYPGSTDPQNETQAYQAKPGSLSPAGEADAAVAAGAAIVHTWANSRHKFVSAGGQAIHIDCDVVEDQVETPCASVLIALSEDGDIFAKGRTDGNGEISFYATPKHQYKVEVKQSDYEVEQIPAGLIVGGTTVQIKLRPRGR